MSSMEDLEKLVTATVVYVLRWRMYIRVMLVTLSLANPATSEYSTLKKLR